MTDIDIFDPRFAPVVAGRPTLEKLATGAIWSEGPVWIAEDDSVLWSDIPNDRMLRWSARDGMSVWRDNVEFTNGHTRDHDGTILHCSHGLRAVFRTNVDGSGQRTVVEESARGQLVDRGGRLLLGVAAPGQARADLVDGERPGREQADPRLVRARTALSPPLASGMLHARLSAWRTRTANQAREDRPRRRS